MQTSYEAALSRITPAPPAPEQRLGPRPRITRGQPIEAYSDAELLRLAQWIRTDDVLRTQDELLQEMMRELGFQRRGKNVVARLTAAITQSATNAPRHTASRDAYKLKVPRVSGEPVFSERKGWISTRSAADKKGSTITRRGKKINTLTTRTRRH